MFTQVAERSTSDILVLRRGGSSATPLVATAADERDPALSPDDRWLAYASNESGRYEVYVRPFGGSGGRIAVSTDGGLMPVWSRDGRRWYYLQDRSLAIADVTAGSTFAASRPRAIDASRDYSSRI